MKRRHLLKNKFKNMSFFKKNLLIAMASLVLVCFTMVGYAALNQTLNITGDLVLRAKKDMRITDLKIVGTPTNAYEQYNSKYTSNTISVFPAFESGSASISYEATITNNGNVDMEITNINKELSDDSVKCNILGIYKDTIISAGTTKTFTITLTGSNSTSDDKSVGLLLEITWDQYYDKYLTYNISGNSIQDGDPTPSTPVAIESVGDKTVNLLDIEDALNSNLTVNNGVYTIKKNSEEERFSSAIYLNLRAGEEYTISYELVDTNSNHEWPLSLVLFSNDNTTQYVGIDKNKTSFTFTVDEDIQSIRIYQQPTETVGTYTSFKNLQLQEGEVATEYEPYGKYKIPVELSGVNLYGGQSKFIINSVYNNTHSSFYKIFEKGKTYGLFCYIDNTQGTANARFRMSVGTVTDGVNGWSYQHSNILTAGKKGWALLNVKIPDNYNGQLNLQFQGSGTVIFDNMMMVYDSLNVNNLPAYVPYAAPVTANIYIDEPLRKVGDYADYIDFESKTLYRNISKFIIPDNSEFNSTSEDTVILDDASSSILKTSDAGMSPIWKYQNPQKDLNTGFLLSSNGNFYWNPDVTEFGVNAGDDNETIKNPALQTWLSSQSDEIKTVYYVLATTDPTSIELPEIIKQPYHSIMTVKTSVQPSDITYEFVKK